MTGRICRVFTLLVGLLLPWELCAAEPATRPARPAPIITRADLAAAYLRVEQMLAQHPPAPDVRPRIHREMDTVAYHFFAGDYRAAVRIMNGICDQLRGTPQPDIRSFVESIRVRVSPRIAQKNNPSIFRIHTTAMLELPMERPIELKLLVRGDEADGKIVFEQKLEFRADAPMPSIATKQPDAPPGRYRVQLVAADGQMFDVESWFVIDRSLDQLRLANRKRLAEIDTREPRIFQAWIACHSRNALLSDRPVEENLAEYLSDPIELAQQVNAEVEELIKGKDPYVLRAGEYFRAIPAGAMSIPSRVYAPQSVKAEKPMPLVIALHGAGADEGIFMQGYGAGKIRRLADQDGFVVVAPNTYWVIPNPSALEGIVAAMAMDYPIDRSRVYVIGHSLGAIAGAGMARRNPKDLAAAVLIAGGSFARNDTTCPVLLMAAQNDPIIRAEQLRQNAADAGAWGLPVEFRLIEEAGHVLVCGEVLDEAIQWLLQHRGKP